VASEPQTGSLTPAPEPDAQPPRGISLKLLVPLMLVLGIAGGSSFVLLHRTPKPTLPAGAQQSPPGDGYDGTLALPARTAPPIQLRNYLGQPVSLSQYRGKAVLVTFLYTNCPDICPLITSNLRVALNLLGRRAADVQIIAVSVDPRGDTPTAVAHFLAAHQMTGRMQYLIGSAGALGQTWSAWGVGARSEADQPNLIAHSALVYGITASGRVKTVYPASFEPSQIAHDVPRLASQ
jgi:protein SCO1/2